jgi:hypothetical protein
VTGLLLALMLQAHAAWKWNQTLSPHFAVSHESAWAPKGFVLSLEKMHNRLRMDLSMFSPWMAKERVNVFLYATQQSYVGGEFQPPPWSNGLSIMERKAVAVYERPLLSDLMETISHETTHLLFQGYWQEVGKVAPSWLNEGLAMREEVANPGEPEANPRYQNMAYWDLKKIIPMKEFLAIRPTEDLGEDKDKDKVVDWYTQAFSIVYFLYRENSRIQFKNLCSRLRDGQELEEVLKSTYRYGSLQAFEQDWRKWLALPTHKRKVERFLSSAQADGTKQEDKFNFKRVQSFSDGTFKKAPSSFDKPR